MNIREVKQAISEMIDDANEETKEHLTDILNDAEAKEGDVNGNLK